MVDASGERQKHRRMPRKLRIQYPGAVYHVINRGDRREDIFKGGADRKLHYGKDRQETDEEKARGIVSAGLRLLGWERQELPARAKSDQG